MEYVILFFFILSSLFIFVYSLAQLHLTLIYLKTKRRESRQTLEKVSKLDVSLPKITVQLPVYNELYVVDRLLESVSAFNYPQEKLEIQVLDDSSDGTTDIIRNKIEKLAEKVNIQHIRRQERTGFKAGALQYGLASASGDFIAIFDADFVPEKNFLLETISPFDDARVGVVQTRWGHINKNYSLLTKMQAFGLDAHFSIEQAGRNAAGSFINFNGTAGIWRKSCIVDSGGWSSDTLTEDLDLSYRAQLRGWKFRYLENVIAPAELPVTMAAIKSQQFRWNKGGAETARKNLLRVLRSDIDFRNKIHASLHLLNSSVYVGILLALILSVPLLIMKNGRPEIELVFQLSSTFILGFFSIAFFYWVSSRKMEPGKSKQHFFRLFPFFLMTNIGMSLHNTHAVITGFLGVSSPFVRTPKFKVVNRKDSWKGNIYNKPTITLITFMEGLLSIYFILGIAVGFFMEDFWLTGFHAMTSIGFGIVFFLSLKEI